LVSQICAAKGHQFEWTMGNYSGTISGFELIDGKMDGDNPTKSNAGLNINVRHTSVVRVRRDRVQAFVDGGLVADWKTNYDDMRLLEGYVFRNSTTLALVTWRTASIFHYARVIEVTGVGKILPRKENIWRYTTDKPNDKWMEASFDDSKWKSGKAGFGTKITPGGVVRTEWKTDDIWIRRAVELSAFRLNEPKLLMHHDDDAEVFVNGVLAVKVSGYTTGYRPFAISAEARRALHPGKNLMAVHCHQYTGGQYIDVWLRDSDDAK
jgi:hypothetical protein